MWPNLCNSLPAESSIDTVEATNFLKVDSITVEPVVTSSAWLVTSCPIVTVTFVASGLTNVEW